MADLERAIQAQAARVNERELAQIRAGETLRTYVAWLFAGSLVVLVGLFTMYRYIRQRDLATQRRMEQLAHFDPVTRIANRSLLTDRLAQEMERARRSGKGFALLLFDLDGFKHVNDRMGHAAGDRVLAAAAERARAVLRAQDTLGRQGGDEFLAILPETSEEGAMKVADKLRESLARPYPVDGGTANVSASIGVSLFPAHGTQSEPLLRAADVALYDAKRAGKNRARLALSASP
jgi:diguanylate cyclase (GGDEF)-like protein